jgi:hypothetical protein
VVIRFLRQALCNLEEIHASYAPRTNPAHGYEVIADCQVQSRSLWDAMIR